MNLSQVGNIPTPIKSAMGAFIYDDVPGVVSADSAWMAGTEVTLKAL